METITSHVILLTMQNTNPIRWIKVTIFMQFESKSNELHYWDFKNINVAPLSRLGVLKVEISKFLSKIPTDKSSEMKLILWLINLNPSN